MSVLLEVYGKRGYARYRLPPVRNADHSIWLSSEVFQMGEPLRISLENVDDRWYIKASGQYFPEDMEKGRRRLVSGHSFDVKTVFGDEYTFTVSEVPSHIPSYGKFRTREVMTIGRSGENDIIIPGKRAVSREHARIIHTEEGWRIQSRSINGLYVNDEFVDSVRDLAFGDHINIMGFGLVFLVSCIAVEPAGPGLSVKLTPAGGIPLRQAGTPEEYTDIMLVHRSPRSLKEIDTSPIIIDAPPEQQKMSDSSLALSITSSFLMSIPMAGSSLFMIYASRMEGGGGRQFYMYGGLIMSAMTLVTAVIWSFIQTIHNHKKEEALWQRHSGAYRDYLKGKENLIRARSEEIRGILEDRYISALNRTRSLDSHDSLWTRTPCHRDFLACRLGTGDMELPADIVLPEEHFRLEKNDLFAGMNGLKEKYKTLTSVPMLISLSENAQIGLAAGSERDRLAMARSMIIQFAGSNCYTETRIGLVYDKESTACKGGWDYMRWLPHVWSENRDFRFLASSKEEARSLFRRLLAVIRKREDSDRDRIPVYILFIEAAHFLEGEPIEKYLIRRGDQCGILVIWLAKEREHLPRSCQLIIEKSEDFQGWYHLMNGDRREISFDFVTQETADMFSRKLSLCKVQERLDSSEIPSGVTFLQMLETESLSELDVIGFWKKNRVMDSLRAPIGLKSGGKKMYLDIHERYHGPHGLVAGTTGSGKSELLQTYILSLLILYGPESVNLFLIDYKGGGMASMFDGIPHLSGQISNLSGSQIYRAMTALRSENKRRQRLFANYQVNNINDYMKLWYDRDDMEPMPHLLIIIDEFAELKKEEPDFMAGLISIAQVGRSLGLHLILATQKPGGVVDDKIWSNSRFRMCLRVQEKQDSMDMLHKPDAADIQQTGRCCFQVGNDEIYEVFQTGWSGAAYTGDDAGDAGKSARLIRLSGEEDIDHLKYISGSGTGETQFMAVKRYLMETAAEAGYKPVRQLWLEPLPGTVYLTGESGPAEGDEGLKEPGTCISGKAPEGCVYMGLADDPANQCRLPVYLRLDVHSVVCGLPMTGKSTFLQTMLYGITESFSPEDAHIYIIDYSNAALKAFENMPHTGAVITEGQEQRCRAFFHMAGQMLDERKQLFEGANYLQYIKSAGGRRVPRVFIFIDNFASFHEKMDLSADGILMRLCKEGPNAGITLILSCGGFSSAELPAAFSDYFKQACCLELKEKFSYSEVLGSLEIPVMPEKGIAGRGILRMEERILEFQTALAVYAKDDYERIRFISMEADRQRESYHGPSPKPVRYISDKPDFGEFCLDREVLDALMQEGKIPIGYEPRKAEILVLDSKRFCCFLVTGRKKSGKHHFFRLFLEMLKRKKREGETISISVIDYRGRLASCRRDPGIDRYLENEQTAYSFLKEIADGIPEVRSSADDREKKEIQHYILIESLGQFLTETGDGGYDSASLSENLWENRNSHRIFFMAMLEEEDHYLVTGLPAFKAFTGYGTGMHLGGNLLEDTLFEHPALPYEEQTATFRPGTGYVFYGEGRADKILIPGMEDCHDPY